MDCFWFLPLLFKLRLTIGFGLSVKAWLLFLYFKPVVRPGMGKESIFNAVVGETTYFIPYINKKQSSTQVFGWGNDYFRAAGDSKGTLERNRVWFCRLVLSFDLGSGGVLSLAGLGCGLYLESGLVGLYWVCLWF